MILNATITRDAAYSRQWDVAVIGAGPAGALAALLLAQAQRRVLLIERKSFPRRKVCGGCLSATGVKILERLGLTPALHAAGAIPLAQVDIRTGRYVARLPLPGGLSISRATLDALLVKQAIDAGVAFLPGTAAQVRWRNRYEVALHEDADIADAQHHSLNAKVVLVADGLGHPSLRACDRFPERVQPSARIGAACILPWRCSSVSPMTISMNVGRRGYVGLVHVEDEQTCVAAALDAAFVREHHSLSSACAAILRSTGIDVADALIDQAWLGAPQLTRRTLRHADENVFLLGDASGYVEPFTGEGMTWAMLSAVDILPFVNQKLTGENVALAWTQHVRRCALQRQHWCRAISFGLRSPWLTHSAMHMLQIAPAVAQPIVQWVTQSRLPELAQVEG